GSELLGSLPKTTVLVLVADQMALHPDRRQLGASAADTAGADARPADLAGKAPVLDFRAAVHDHRQAGGFRLCGGLLVPHTELHPHDANAEAVLLRDSLAGHLERRLRIAEDVDDADRWRNFRQAPVDRLSQDLLPREPYVDGHDGVTLAEQILHREVARAVGVRTR